MAAQVIKFASMMNMPMVQSEEGATLGAGAEVVVKASSPAPSKPRFVPLFERAEVRAWVRERAERVLPAMVGFGVLALVWAIVATTSPYLPGPGKTLAAAIEMFRHPFYQHGPNDVGVGWNVLHSLERVGMGFGLAALVGIPFGFMLGRFVFLNRAASPIISILRPVSPLAWLPIGLAVFKAAHPAAVFVIFVCSIWPMVINTAVGVANVPQDYLNVARVLNLSEWKIFTRILLPATVPYVLTGARLALGIAWLVIVASEMLTGGTGIGFWVWDEWNNLNMEHIIIAIFIIGTVGLLLEAVMTRIAQRFEYGHR